MKYKTEELAHKQKQERLEKRVILFGAIALIAVLLLIVTVGIYTSRKRRRNHMALKKLSALREHFFTNITHEFRTPLTIILGLSHDLEANEAAEVRDKALAINRQGKALLELINQLLDIAKVKSAVGKADWRNGNIMAYLTMVVESYQDFAKSHNIQLQYLSKGDVKMDFAPDYVNKVMNNLLSNAFKFTPEFGKISVAAWRENNLLHIDVSDTGTGMDQETMAHVFEPFFRASNTGSVMGQGVGLALAKAILEKHGARIKVEFGSIDNLESYLDAQNKEGNFKGKEATVTNSGVGNITLNVDCNKLTASNDGVGKLRLSGTADDTNIDGSGVSEIDSSHLNNL